MNQDQERYKANSGTTSTVTRALPNILRQVKENSLSILSNQINEFFNSCDDLFFELANHAGSNSEQNLYFDSMREIRLRKKDIVNSFKENFSAHFTELVKPNLSQYSRNDHTATSYENLGLVADDKMEQDVAISSVISKTRQDCQESLYHLCLRFDYLLSDLQVTESNNPLDPKQICEAFTQAAAPLDIDIKARIILFKQFDRMVARHLNKIYNLANELLINAGILPKVTPSLAKKATSKTRPPNTFPKSEEGEHVNPEVTDSPDTESVPDQQPVYTFDQLTNLLAGIRATTSGASAGSFSTPINTSTQSFGAAISQDKLLDQLTELQRGISPEDGPQTKEKFQTAIYQILQTTGENGKPSSLHQSDEDVINLVAMFFEFILDDRNLPVPIQALISRLQIPVLKIALKDKNFFNNSKHVARILINEIASASIGWVDANKNQQDQLFELINSIVHKINDEFVGDCNVFEKELERLRAYKEQESKRASVVESRTNQAAEGKAKTDHAKQLVQNILLQRLNNQELPESITNFLIEQWQRVLLLVRLKSGDSSPEWLSHLQVVDDLIWVAHYHKDEKSQKRAQRIKPKLLEAIQAGLSMSSINKKELDNIVAELSDAIDIPTHEDATQASRIKLKPEQLAALGQAPEGVNKSWKEMSALERQQVKQKALQYEFLK